MLEEIKTIELDLNALESLVAYSVFAPDDEPDFDIDVVLEGFDSEA
jgi:hypothetical protein